MKRLAIVSILIAALALAAAAPALAQSTFKIPFKFESGGKKFAAGEYAVSKTGDAQLTFTQVATAKETVVAFKGPVDAADPAADGPRLVFDEVGNFEPSYTEYFTVYELAQVWLSAKEGYLVHTTKGAHKTRVVTAEALK